MKITRRELASTLSVAALAKTAPAAPAEDLNEAKTRVLRNSEFLAKIEVSISTEPAFQFKP